MLKESPIEKRPRNEKNMENIHEVKYEECFDESKVKFPKDCFTRFRTELHVPQLIPVEVKNKIQQVDL